MNYSTVKPVRSWLFTPATRSDRFPKAAAAHADVLIIDLEDGVAPVDKDRARDAALAYLTSTDSFPIAKALRMNPLETPAGKADLQAVLASSVQLDFLILPKTEQPASVQLVDQLLTQANRPERLIALIENARGLSQVEAIALSTARLTGMMFGPADMAADLGATASWEPLLYARSRLVAAAALGDLIAIDGPCFRLEDPTGLAVEISRSLALGFTAKAAIHPAQIDLINTQLTPSREMIARAQSILAATAAGVGVVDGQMVDEAMARNARRVLRAAAVLVDTQHPGG